jgi:hypothetical protein
MWMRKASGFFVCLKSTSTKYCTYLNYVWTIKAFEQLIVILIAPQNMLPL